MESKVTQLLKSGPRTNQELRNELKSPSDKADPKLDRLLQKLRKDGKIQVYQGRWALSSVKACPRCKGHGWISKK